MKSLSVRMKILALMFVFAASGALFFHCSWVPRITAILVEAQTREARRQVEIIGDSILPYLLSNQFAAIYETLSAIQERNENWTSIELYRDNGRRIFPLSQPGVSDSEFNVDLEHDVVLRGDQLGFIRASIDLQGPIQSIKDELKLLFDVAMVVFVLSTFFVIFIFDRLLTRRLAMLGRASKAMARGDFKTALPSRARDEIGQLTQSFSSMRDKIHHQTRTLHSARLEAENALAAKSQFLATMSHEIRTPLNGVIPVATLLLQSDLSEKQSEHVETIRESGEALLSIVDDILDLASIEEGRLTLKEEPMTLGQIGQSINSILGTSAREKGLDLIVHVGDMCLTPLIGDAGRIRQVLINLVGNAIKFSENGAIEVRCELTEDRGDTVVARVEVEDNGIGIAPEAQQRVFDRFEQAETGNARRFEGSGLGLAISKSIVEAHGGEIGVRSVPGEGSTFWFTLVCKKAKSASDTTPPEGTEAGQRLLPRASHARVLVADDHEINRMVVEAMLEDLGVDTVSVEEGSKAFELVSNQDFDLVFMDMHMPVMDGLEATRKIKAIPSSRSATKVIALTASVLDEDVELCRAAGMDGVLTKPVSKQDLVNCLNSQLGHR